MYRKTRIKSKSKTRVVKIKIKSKTRRRGNTRFKITNIIEDKVWMKSNKD
jgi:hypothetical protein